ncbi:MAG: ATP-binding protein, partial [Thermodesulfobacteriota bacterium]|nr:ATP-binding protein [Thermodesulfobacteriota bacterium]
MLKGRERGAERKGNRYCVPRFFWTTVEWKPSLSQINEIVETVSAFSNARGGVIVVGISNTGKVSELHVGKDTIERLANKIISNTDPKIYPDISVKKVDGKSIILIEVKESPDKLILAFGRPFKRVGKSTHKMSKDEYERNILQKHRDKLQFDKQICENVNLKDVDKRKVRWFINEARKHRDLKIADDAKPKDILRQVGLLQNDKLTNAALLLFAKEPRFIQSEVKCIRFKGNKPVKPYIDFQTLDGNVFDLVDQALDFVLRNIKKAVWLVPGQVQREEKYEYPPDAIREAIVNAIVHRDYFSPSKVQVRVFDDYMEIWNPGELPKGWTVKKLAQKHESIPRNPLLFKQFFWVKYVEDVGGGTIDIIRECREWGLAEPDFEYTGTSLVVILRKSKLTEDYLTSLGLNERQKKAIEFLRE